MLRPGRDGSPITFLRPPVRPAHITEHCPRTSGMSTCW
jgi:hypothetical protein